MVASTTTPYGGQAVGQGQQQPLPFARKHFILRIVQFVVTIVVFALFAAARGLAGASIFAGVWTVLISIYHLAAHFNPKIYHALVALILDVIGLLIWFGSFISNAIWIVSAGSVLAAHGVVGTFFALSVVGTICAALLWLSYGAALAMDIIRFRRSRAAAAAAAADVKMQEQDSSSATYSHNGAYQQNVHYQRNVM